MKEEKICPYPGLRPFNDDESIFFKGRDHNIDVIIELFEKKKFMMLTGASGDGKSSLVYAGVVPNARAGLFKAKYNNWAVADFRPERSPLENLAQALNRFFGFESTEALKKELAYGFSSLATIYKNSPLYIDPASEEWTAADEATKKQLKRKAGNLLIIADQFEEFFTNTENYYNGIASVESQTTINLLLETARIALADDLPIYIICTMRSDYIGQCAAFRGLPEMIGFSQFFVPRLKRNEIAQVIEEPAQLNGDSISRRLSERLLNDITEGYDQLPILQHALNQIWKIAGNGAEPMDLLHYAKVGGLSKDQLSAEDRQKFEGWFEGLPDFKKQLFKNPSLENILNAHANELYETAYARFAGNHLQKVEAITAEDSKLIIKTAYQCLTKIDEARAVRNRMTLDEITRIINQSRITSEIVGKILDIFREQGNTFIKPFITEDPETRKTHNNTVFDITHESLIRNWDLLDAWAKEEYDNWLNFQDFNKQLQRWVENKKHKGYLLPIGPLTFFEKWYNTCKPNKYWLSRYDEREISKEEKLATAEATLENAKEFIRKSSHRLFFSRTVLKYGANRLAAIFALMVFLCPCTYYYFNYREKQNDSVIEKVNERSLELLQSSKVKNDPKAAFVINYERLNPGTFEILLKEKTDHDSSAFDIAEKMFWQVQNYTHVDRDTLNPMTIPLMDYMDRHLGYIRTYVAKSRSITENDLKRLNTLIKICILANIHSRTDTITRILNKNAEVLDRIFYEKLGAPVDSLKPATHQFNESLQLIAACGSKNQGIDLAYIAKRISPFETEEGKKRFDKLYPKETKWKVDDWNNNYLAHNGGYQLLAYIYAGVEYVGSNINTEKILRCLDSICASNKEYKSYEYQGFTRIVGYLLRHGKFTEKEAQKLINKYAQLSGLSAKKITEASIEMVCDQKLYNIWWVFHPKDWNDNIVGYTLTYNERNAMWSYYESLLKKESKAGDDENFQRAMFLKKRGIYLAQHPADKEESYKCFAEAFNYYSKTGEKYLSEDFIIGTPGTPDSKTIKKSALFLYPVLVKEQSSRSGFFNSYTSENLFGEYIMENGLVKYYRTKDDYDCIGEFLYNYYNICKRRSMRNNFNYAFFDWAKQLAKNNVMARAAINNDFMDLVFIVKAFDDKDTTKALALYRQLNKKKILATQFQKETDPMGDVHTYLLKELSKELAVNYRTREAMQTLYALGEPVDKRNTIIDIIYLLQQKGPVEETFVYMDTLYSNMGREQKFGLKLLRCMGIIGSQAIFNEATALIKDVNDSRKPAALKNFISGMATTGLYYKAYITIPGYVASTNELELNNELLHAEVMKKVKTLSLWKRFDSSAYGSDNWGDYERTDGMFIVEEE